MLESLFSTMIFPALASVVTVLCLALFITSRLKAGKPSNIPPFPAKPYMILGHIPYFRGGQQRKVMKQWRKQAGDIFSIYMGSTFMVVINSYTLLKETLVKNADSFTARPTSFWTKSGLSIGSLGIINASGDLWKEQRTVSLSILREFGMGKNILAVKIQEEVREFLEQLAQLKGKPSDIRDLTNAAISNVICSIIIGRRFQYDDPYFLKFLHINDQQARLLTGTSLCVAFPWLRFVPGDIFNGRKLIKCAETVTQHFSEYFIGKTMQTMDSNSPENFIASYALDMKKKQSQGRDTTMNETCLTVVINNLFIAGSETTSTTILWFLLYMIHFPDIQNKVFQSIDDAIGQERLPTMQDKPKLNYLNAAIMETQRLGSIVPFSLFHKCTADTQIGGFTIPEGATVVPNLDAVLHDEQTWGDPLNFRPERFLDDKGELISYEEFIPFSLGRRVCLGEALAKMELFLFVAAIMQRFELLPANPEHLPPREDAFGVTAPPKSYHIKFQDRRGA